MEQHSNSPSHYCQGRKGRHLAVSLFQAWCSVLWRHTVLDIVLRRERFASRHRSSAPFSTRQTGLHWIAARRFCDWETHFSGLNRNRCRRRYSSHRKSVRSWFQKDLIRSGWYSHRSCPADHCCGQGSWIRGRHRWTRGNHSASHTWPLKKYSAECCHQFDSNNSGWSCATRD